MEATEERRIIEALILASPEPVNIPRIASILPGVSAALVKDRINELNTEYQEQDRAFEIWEVAGGFQIRTRAEFSGYVQKLRKDRPLRLSQAALETVAIIAYKQPITRAELELVRGVDSGAILKSLLERRLLRLVGHREVPGRPLVYGTSKRFLEIFGLESLKELPSLRELEELAREQGLEVVAEDDLADGAEADAPVTEDQNLAEAFGGGEAEQAAGVDESLVGEVSEFDGAAVDTPEEPEASPGEAAALTAEPVQPGSLDQE
ncbi:MAG: SMC-Scp complex subunit ScpB [Myxococcota bacterium]|jgi:segregation and condensation protein B|nr:SMC-Scp complex subunit ScpB [Myxococcota bacterium]